MAIDVMIGTLLHALRPSNNDSRVLDVHCNDCQFSGSQVRRRLAVVVVVVDGRPFVRRCHAHCAAPTAAVLWSTAAVVSPTSTGGERRVHSRSSILDGRPHRTAPNASNRRRRQNACHVERCIALLVGVSSLASSCCQFLHETTIKRLSLRRSCRARDKRRSSWRSRLQL